MTMATSGLLEAEAIARADAYRARIGDHWEGRVSCADDQPLPSPPRPGRLHAESTDVQ